ncbi:hypothetical protein BJ170DRAFT_683977 [Xylariales sp. AK1849]|nr:hypothetical protein BJ170DRAFT_683977 [Xylariales sp. AK1849]
MLNTFVAIILALTGAIASPYLEFCNLLDLQDRADQGVVIQAQCGDGRNYKCQELDITPCFANAWGQIIPSEHTLGHFNGTCTNCKLGTAKNDTESYGHLQCQCQNGSPGAIVNATYDTAAVVRYETELGMMCPYANSSAVRSTSCVDVIIVQGTGTPTLRGREIRRSLRSRHLWRTD